MKQKFLCDCSYLFTFGKVSFGNAVNAETVFELVGIDVKKLKVVTFIQYKFVRLFYYL